MISLGWIMLLLAMPVRNRRELVAPVELKRERRCIARSLDLGHERCKFGEEDDGRVQSDQELAAEVYTPDGSG